jgi:hypothetical protein
MKIAVLTRVRNEASIIEAFVRHHAEFADYIGVMTHRCMDNTKDIVESLRKEGLPVELSDDPQYLHGQAGAMTAFIQETLKTQKPDWILLLDADEFLVSTDGRSVRKALEEAGNDACLSVAWRTYVPVETDDDSERNVLRRISHRKTEESPVWTKCMVPSTLLIKAGAFSVLPGNHAMLDGSLREFPHRSDPSLSIAHFPVRSSIQIMNKVLGGWLSHAADPDRSSGAGFQWKVIYDALKNGKTPTGKELTEFALHYATVAQWQTLPASFRTNVGGHLNILEKVDSPAIVNDPVPSAFDLKYPMEEAEPMHVLMEEAERLADEHKTLLGSLTDEAL